MTSMSARGRLRTLVGALTIGLAATLGLAYPAETSVSPAPTKTAGLSGEAVFDLVVLDGGRVILGGRFNGIGAHSRANLGAVLANGKPDLAFGPTTNGEVRAVAVSEDGKRVFIGGTFTEVNGVARNNLAAVDAVTGDLISRWRADTSGAAPMVRSLTVDGNRLYVGGRFEAIGGSSTPKLAAVKVSTGDLVAWRPSVNGNVNEVRVAPDGNTVWIGGSFTKIRGVRRSGLGGIDADTGVPIAFNRPASTSMVITLALSADGTWLYASTHTNNVHAYRPAVSNNPVWTTRTNGNVQAIAISPTEIYIGGHFTQFASGLARRSLASVNPATGAPTTWNPKATGLLGGGWALVIKGNNLHAGGQFTHFDGVQQRLYARFPGATP